MFNEKDLVSKILNGDYRAFELLTNHYKKLVFFVIRRLVREKEDVEDICQEVFIKVFKSLHRFEFQSKLSTWIARIAYLTAINHVKRSKERFFVNDAPDLDRYHFTNENPEVILAKKNTTEYVNGLIAQMPVQYRTVLTLFHLNEFSCQEIEEITGMPEGTIKSYLFRGRKLLKEKLESDLRQEEYEGR